MFDLYYPSKVVKDNEILLIELMNVLKKENPINRKNLIKCIRKFVKKSGKKSWYPSLWHLMFIYYRHFFQTEFPKSLVQLFKTVHRRSISGVVPLSVFTQPHNSCPYHCIYCTDQMDAPKSYFSDEPAVKRAARDHYDPFKQVRDRLIQFILLGHPIDKVDIIVQGGTFSFYDRVYREWFIKRIFECCNGNILGLIINGNWEKKDVDTLEIAQTQNESSKSRVVGITIETRPDFITQDEIIFLRKLGVTRVEIGVQTTDLEVLRAVKRGHTLQDVVQASKLLKDSGFKITYHMMPGLPGSSVKKDLGSLREIFTNEIYLPDALKLYPTQVVWKSELYKWYTNKKFIPLSEAQLIKIVLEFKKNIVPVWTRIHRLVRDLTTKDVAVPTFPSNFRQNLEKILLMKKIICQCIRCREIQGKEIFSSPKIQIIQYKSSEGLEYFIQSIDKKNQLLGFIRLRIPSYSLHNSSFFIRTLEHSSIIRELHVFGTMVPIGKSGMVQHSGIGEQLLREAEKITRHHQIKHIAVISGIGVRNYYRKWGYELKDLGYMRKDISL